MLQDTKFIVLDLDDTLLRDDKSISMYNRRVLQQCRERDILVLVATARPLRDVKRVCQGLALDGIISNNGASVYIKDELIHSSPIDGKGVKKIIQGFFKLYPKGQMIIESGDKLYSNQSGVLEGWEYVPIECIDLNTFQGDEVYKIIITGFGEEDCLDLGRVLPKEAYVVMGQHNHAMIMKRSVNKATGLLSLLKLLNLKPQEGMAFGDDYNDLDILNIIGASVAMGNAIMPVKEAAKFITLSNEEDGVGAFLEDNVLTSRGIWQVS